MTQCMTKPTIRLVRLMKDQPAYLGSLIRVFTDGMCLLLPPGYPKRDKGEPFPY